MKKRPPYFLSEVAARRLHDRGSHWVSHGFINQIFVSPDLRSRTCGYVSSAFDPKLDPILEGDAFSFKSFLTSYCPKSEASHIREVSLIYVRQINEAARLITQRTPPVAFNVLALQADIDELSMRRLDTLLLRKRRPHTISASEMLEGFRRLSRVFR